MIKRLLTVSASGWSSPCDVQGLLDFGLHRAQQVRTHLLQQLGKQDKEPVLQVVPVHRHKVHERLQEHAENLGGGGNRHTLLPAYIQAGGAILYLFANVLHGK